MCGRASKSLFISFLLGQIVCLCVEISPAPRCRRVWGDFFLRKSSVSTRISLAFQGSMEASWKILVWRNVGYFAKGTCLCMGDTVVFFYHLRQLPSVLLCQFGFIFIFICTFSVIFSTVFLWKRKYCNPGNFSKLINLVNWRFWRFISY